MELRDYLRGLRRYWLAVVLMTIAGVLVAAGWASLQKPLYQATASAYIAAPKNAKSSGSIGGQGSAFAQSFVDSFTNYAGWKSTAEKAATEAGITTAPEALVTDISIVNPTGTAILNITATGESPEAAARLANAWIVGLHSTIDSVEGTTTKTGFVPAPMNVFVGNPAVPSATPVFPDWKTAMLVGGIVGLGFGVAFAFTRTASDRRIRDGDEASEKLGHPVVGTIPARPTGSKKRGRGLDTSFAFAESLRVLRTNLQFMDVDNPPRTIVVTSPVPGDGKSTVACELAKALAASGVPTVLIDGDLRRPTVASKMGLPAGAGLSDVLAGRATVTELLQRVPGIANLLVLTAGTVPPNPSEILGSERMRSLLDYLSGEATVIIDAPPLLPVTDGAVLTHQADGALLVVTAGKTTFDLAGKAFGALENARGRALGMVINKAPMRGADASPYAYDYYTYYSTNTPAAPPAAVKTTNADAQTQPVPTEHVADDPFAEASPSFGRHESEADEELDLDDVFTPLLEDDQTPRTTRDRSRRS